MLKKILIGLGVLLLILALLVGAGLVLLVVKVNSPEFAQVVKQGIKDQTGLVIDFSKQEVGFGTVTIDDFRIPNPAASADENLIYVEKIHADLSFLALIVDSTFKAKKLEITKPKITVRQDKDGNLVLPFNMEELKAKLGKKAAAEVAEEQEPKAMVQIELPVITVTGAEITFYNSDQAVLFGTKNANLNVFFRQSYTERYAKGDFYVDELTYAPGMKITKLQSPLKFEKNVLSLKSIKGVMYEGEFQSTADIDTNNKPITYQTTVQLSKVNLPLMMTDIGSDPETLKGILDLNFAGGGNLDAPKEISGGGTFKVEGTQVPKLQKLNLLGKLMGVKAFEEGKFESTEGTYTIASQKLELKPLDVKSENLNVPVTGTVDFEKNLDLKTHIDLNPAYVPILRPILSLGEGEAQGLPVTITGTADNPDIKVKGISVQKLAGVINGAGQLLQDGGQGLKDTANGLLNNFNKPTTTPSGDESTQEEKKSGGLFDSFTNPFKKKESPTPTPAPEPEAAEPTM